VVSVESLFKRSFLAENGLESDDCGVSILVRQVQCGSRLTAQGTGSDVATRFELLDEVWGYESDVMSRTIDTHIGQLHLKLERDPASPQHILTVRKSGYRLRITTHEDEPPE